MSGVTGRKEPKIKESSGLAYDVEKSRKFVMKAHRSHEIGRSPRNFSFTRQVILSTRGCYR